MEKKLVEECPWGKYPRKMSVFPHKRCV